MKSLRRHGIRDITKVRETTKRERSPERDKPALRRDRWRKRAKIDALKSVPCTDCGGLFIPYVMDFDHREGEEKLFNISAAIPLSISFERVLVEAAKCDVVCANCHRMRTWKRMERDRKPIPMPSAPQTCCPKGHSYTEENTRVRRRKGRGDGRECRQCSLDKYREKREANGETYNPTGPKPRIGDRTCCLRGHPYTSENTRVRLRKNGSVTRDCLVCAREKYRKDRDR